MQFTSMTIRWKSGNLISGKSDVTCSINHDFTRIRIYSYNSLPIEKTLTFLRRMKITTTIIYF